MIDMTRQGAMWGRMNKKAMWISKSAKPLDPSYHSIAHVHLNISKQHLCLRVSQEAEWSDRHLAELDHEVLGALQDGLCQGNRFVDVDRIKRALDVHCDQVWLNLLRNRLRAELST